MNVTFHYKLTPITIFIQYRTMMLLKEPVRSISEKKCQVAAKVFETPNDKKNWGTCDFVH